MSYHVCGFSNTMDSNYGICSVLDVNTRVGQLSDLKKGNKKKKKA